MAENNQDLLNVSINEAGLAHLKRLAASTKWTLVTGIVLGSLYIINAIFQRLLLHLDEYKTDPALYFFMASNFWVVMLGSILSMTQIYLFRRFSRRGLEACEAADNEGFNRTLISLIRSNRIAQAIIVLYLAFSGLQLVIEFNAILRISHFPH